MNKCDNCEQELDRHLFCSNKCRMRFVRKANKKMTDNSLIVRKANSIDETEYREPERKPLSWRDTKGQCQHGRKTCSLCL